MQVGGWWQVVSRWEAGTCWGCQVVRYGMTKITPDIETRELLATVGHSDHWQPCRRETLELSLCNSTKKCVLSIKFRVLIWLKLHRLLDVALTSTVKWKNTRDHMSAPSGRSHPHCTQVTSKKLLIVGFAWICLFVEIESCWQEGPQSTVSAVSRSQQETPRPQGLSMGPFNRHTPALF